MANEEYQALVLKVEGFLDAVAGRRASDLACKRGCDACCHTWLTLSAVEAEPVEAALSALAAASRERVRARGRRELARAEQAASGAPGDTAPPRCAML
jgi:hypothetical protein